jgi:hypothetical protein
MAINRWRGDAPAVSQVVTLVVGSTTAGHTFITTMNGKSITYTAGGAETTSTIATAIQELLSASTIPEFQEVTWTVDTATVTGTAATPGVPFTVSKSGTGTYTLTTVTASSGPNHADLAANWSLGTTPGSTDDVLIDGGPDLLYIGSLAGAAYNSFRVKASFTGAIGLPLRNEAGYIEYRTRVYPINNAVPVTIGEGDGQGPFRVNLTCGTAISLVVHKTGNRQSDSIPVVNVVGSSSGTVTVASGDVGLASDDDNTAITVTTLTVDNDAVVTVGNGATATTVNQTGGQLMAYGTVTTLNIVYPGIATLFGMPTTITADGGTINLRGTGTITTLTARGQGDTQFAPRVNCDDNPRAKTFTNCTFTGGASLNDPDKSVTFTNAGTWDRASLLASDLGSRFTLTRT